MKQAGVARRARVELPEGEQNICHPSWESHRNLAMQNQAITRHEGACCGHYRTILGRIANILHQKCAINNLYNRPPL